MAWNEAQLVEFKQALLSAPDNTNFGTAVHTVIEGMSYCPANTGVHLRRLLSGAHLQPRRLEEPFGWSAPSPTRQLSREGCSDGHDPIILVCFHKDTTVLVPPKQSAKGNIPKRGGSLLGRAQVRMMRDLRAGDEVLTADERTGEIRTDRVSLNLHLQDTSVAYAGVTLYHASGHISVTLSHMIILNGRPTAARHAKVGDLLQVHHVSGAVISLPALRSARILQVSRWQGGIINPLTDSGRILAGPIAGKTNITSFVLATTVLESPHNVQLLVTSMPSLLKLGSRAFPKQLQRSSVVEGAVMAECWATSAFGAVISYLPKGSGLAVIPEWVAWAASLVLFVLMDIVVGGMFVVLHVLSLPRMASCVVLVLICIVLERMGMGGKHMRCPAPSVTPHKQPPP